VLRPRPRENVDGATTFRFRWREKRRAQGLAVGRPRRPATEERRVLQREATRLGGSGSALAT
jgi:hypothetical protein